MNPGPDTSQESQVVEETFREAYGQAVATLPSGTRVKVLEANLPWIRVQTVPPRGQAPQTGWLKAFETVEASALARNAKPAHKAYTGAGVNVSSTEVSAAATQPPISTSAIAVKTFGRRRSSR